MVPLLVFGAVFSLVGLLVFLVIRHSKERVVGIQNLGRELKLRYFPDGHVTLDPILARLDFFAHGQRRVSNLLLGRVSINGELMSVAIFDYQYTMTRTINRVYVNNHSIDAGTADESASFIQTVVMFHDSTLRMPTFHLRPEFALDRVAALAGYDDVDFDEHAEFSKRYCLLGPDHAGIRALFKPSLIAHFESDSICAQGKGGYVMVWPFPASMNFIQTAYMEGVTHLNSKLLNADEIKHYLKFGAKLVGLLR